MNYVWDFSQSETEKYFEWIITLLFTEVEVASGGYYTELWSSEVDIHHLSHWHWGE